MLQPNASAVSAPPPLKRLAAAINAAHAACHEAEHTALGHALRAGDALIEVKERVGHGNFLPWVAAHCKFSLRLARAAHPRTERARPPAEHPRVACPRAGRIPRGRELCAIVTFVVPRAEPGPVKQALDERRINSSLSYREYAIHAFDESGADWCIRLSPHCYNTESEVADVLAAVEDVTRAYAR